MCGVWYRAASSVTTIVRLNSAIAPKGHDRRAAAGDSEVVRGPETPADLSSRGRVKNDELTLGVAGEVDNLRWSTTFTPCRSALKRNWFSAVSSYPFRPTDLVLRACQDFKRRRLRVRPVHASITPPRLLNPAIVCPAIPHASPVCPNRMNADGV